MKSELETRKCITNGEILSKEELLRFTLLKNGTVLPDFDKKIGGRGFYLSNSRKQLSELSSKQNPLNKLLHTKTIMSEDLPDIVAKILAKKGLDMLNIARKSGELVLGFEKVKENLLKNKIAFIVIATDCGEDGLQKICRISPDVEIFSLYDSAVLSQALCRENTVYMAINKGQIENAVHIALQRYQTYLNE